MSLTENPRAIVGDNRSPDYAREATDRMARDYAESAATLARLLDEARGKPKEVGDDATALDMGALVKKLRDLDARLEAFRVAEKEPYLRGGNAVDNYFNQMRDKIGRRKATDMPGACDVLGARVGDYQERKRAEEQRRRDLEAAELRRKAELAAAEQRRRDHEAEEARLAAERARAPAQAELKAKAAAAAAAEAAGAAVEAELSANKADEAHISSIAKPADMARTRGDDGVLLTMKSEPYAVIEDRNRLDYAKLAPFFTASAVEAALRAWARNTGFTVPMDGAKIGKRPRSVIR